MMQSFRCTNCAAPLEIENAFSSFIKCGYCGVSSKISNDSAHNNFQFGFGTGGDDLLDQARKLKEIKHLALSGQKINAIKIYRETFGVGLKEAKDAVDNIADGKPVVFTNVQTFPAAANNFPANSGETVGETVKFAEIQSLLKRGNKIQAIKVYRETFGVGLKEAKDAVDEMERNGRGNPSVPADSQQPFVPRYLMQQQYDRPKSSTGKILFVVIILVIIGVLAALYFSGKMPNGISSVIDKTREIAPSLPVIKGSDDSSFAREVSKFGGDGSSAGLFKDNRTIAVDNDGKIYSADFSGGKIQVFDAQGKFQTQITADTARTIDALAVDGRGNLFVLQGYDLHRFNLQNTEDHSKIRFPSASDVAVGADGTIYVSIRTGDIKAVSPGGEILKTIQTMSAGVKGITSLAIDAAGNFYALESNSLFVFKLSPEGKFLTKFGGGSPEAWEKVPPGLFYGRPNDLAIDKAGRVYVSQGVKISVFSSEDTFIGDFNTKQAFGMAFNESGDLFVATRPFVTKYEVKK